MANKYTQRPDGRYSTRVWDGTYKNNAKHYKTLYANSSKELENMVLELERRVQKGEITIKSSMTIGDYSSQWLNTYKTIVEKSTKQMYENLISVHMEDLKNKSFEYFTFPNIQDAINNCSEKPRTCQQLAMTLKQIGRASEFDKLMPKGTTDAIFDRIQLPKYEAKEKRALTTAEIHTLKTHVWSHKQRLFLNLIYFCGLRREEALALTWNDIEGDYVNVNKACGFYAKKPYIKKPKSKNGTRKVPMPSELRKIVAECKEQMPPTEYIFLMANGELMTTDSYRAFWRSIQRVFETDLTAHIFRHNYCTRLCYASLRDNTITLKKIAELMGDNINMVNDVYSHIIDEKEETFKAIESAF